MMNSVLSRYLEMRKEKIKHIVSALLTTQDTRNLAKTAFDFHFNDKKSLGFQRYYCQTVSNRNGFLFSPFFHDFKQRYALQGVDGNYLDRLERQKKKLLGLIEAADLPTLYDEFFADVSLQHKQSFRSKTLGSFFAKFVHTFRPDEYC